MRLLGVTGDIWDRDRLHAYLADPAGHIPGTSMDYAGIADEQQRRDLLTYMRTASLAPPPSPGTLVLDADKLAMVGDIDYGAYLSGECLSCHLPDQAASGIPNIYTLPRDAFVYAMHEYRLKSRANPAMQMIAGALDDEAIASLASYFAEQ